MPENKSGRDQSYRITVYSKEEEKVAVVITVTVKSKIVLSADVAVGNQSGSYDEPQGVNSDNNQTLALKVSSGTGVKFDVSVSNSDQGYAAKAEQTDGGKDISGLISYAENGFSLTMPENKSGQDQSYRITVYAKEDEKAAVVITVTVKSKAEPSTESTEPSTESTEPSTEATGASE